jgi:RNA recognition motif-containing protein
MEVKLYVGNLAYTTTVDDLRILFAQAGSIHSIDLIKDRDTGESKGFAFVTMSTQADAAKAIGMFNDFTMQNREMKVNAAKTREERGEGGSQGRPGAAGPRLTPHKHRPRGGNRRY